MDPLPLLGNVKGRIVFVPVIAAPKSRGLLSMSKWGGGAGPFRGFGGVGVGVWGVLSSSATIGWDPVSQSLAMLTATFAEPARPTRMMEEPPTIAIGS